MRIDLASLILTLVFSSLAFAEEPKPTKLSQEEEYKRMSVGRWLLPEIVNKDKNSRMVPYAVFDLPKDGKPIMFFGLEVYEGDKLVEEPVATPLFVKLEEKDGKRFLIGLYIDHSVAVRIEYELKEKQATLRFSQPVVTIGKHSVALDGNWKQSSDSDSK